MRLWPGFMCCSSLCKIICAFHYSTTIATTIGGRGRKEGEREGGRGKKKKRGREKGKGKRKE